MTHSAPPDPGLIPGQRLYLLLGAMLVAGSALLFSVKAVLVKCVYPYGVDALTLLTLRMGISLPLFAIIAWFEQRRRAHTLPAGDLSRCLGLGILGYYLASFLDFEGLRFIGVGLERMVLYIYPTIVVLVGAIAGRQRISPLVAGALVATYAGIGLTYAGRSHDGAQRALGCALVAGSAVTYALFVLGSSTMIARLGARAFMSVAMVGACLAMLLHAAIAALIQGGSPLFCLPPVVYAYGAALALLCTVAPALLMGDGLKRVGAQRFAIISTIGPLGTVLLGWLLLGEALTPVNGLGIALTMAAGVAMGIGK